jgi:two-component SAPR family response regulator
VSPAKKKPDPVPEPEPAPLSADDVRERTANLFMNLLNEAEHILKAGTTANKISLMKSVIPALMRELQSQNEVAAATAQKEALEHLFAQTRTQLPGFDK